MSLFIQGDRGQRGGMGEAGPKGEQVSVHPSLQQRYLLIKSTFEKFYMISRL